MSEALFANYGTTADGISDEEVLIRLKKYGRNVLSERKKTPLVIQFLAEFKDLMVLILIFAAGISAFEGELRDSIVILCIVLLNATIGFIQKFKAEKALEALKKLLYPKARVLRNGKQSEIPAGELVPGDILIINEGDKVTADAIIFEEHELSTNESALTGESIPVKKSVYSDKEESACTIFMGTEITHGTGRAIVIKTGMNTTFGKIAELTTTTKKDISPLQNELNGIGKYVGGITLMISAVLIFIGTVLQHTPFAKSFLFATSVAVAAVPEGLPATVTIALAMGVQRLARKNAIVKQLSSVETLGSTTVICSDKTGTLTRNEMTVTELFIDHQTISVSGVGYDPTSGHVEQTTHADVLKKTAEIVALCNNAVLQNKDGRFHILGDPTEGALLTFAEKAGFPPDRLAVRFKKISELPFDSIRKRMTVIVEEVETKKRFAFVKGAPDSIVPLCADIDHTLIFKKNSAMAERALRVIACAWKELPSGTTTGAQKIYTVETVEHDLTFSSLVGMIDPPRREVKESVILTHRAGIKVYIVTGDHGLTAAAIAKELGIVKTDNPRIITGEEMKKLSDTALSDFFLEDTKGIIFARVNPEDKLRIVSILKKQDHVVAVTGDGVNDAPALKRADIGIAMGITGTDVSKEASNMVLADDSFSTIVAAIQEGRTIYENLKKFMYYIFSSNIGELITVFTALALALPSPLTAILILMVNVGTDVLPALALGVDPAETDSMNKPPRKPHDRIMNRSFIWRYVILGSYMGIIVVGGYFWMLFHLGWRWGDPLSPESMDYTTASSFAFALLVVIQMINTFNARSDHQSVFSMGLFSNKYLLVAITLSIIATVALVEVEFLQQWIHTTSLDAASWAIIVLFSLSVLVIEEIRKIFVRSSLTTST